MFLNLNAQLIQNGVSRCVLLASKFSNRNMVELSVSSTTLTDSPWSLTQLSNL